MYFLLEPIQDVKISLIGWFYRSCYDGFIIPIWQEYFPKIAEWNMEVEFWFKTIKLEKRPPKTEWKPGNVDKAIHVYVAHKKAHVGCAKMLHLYTQRRTRSSRLD